MSEKWDVENLKELKRIIEMIVDDRVDVKLKSLGITTTKSAKIVGEQNSDGTYNMKIVPDNTIISGKLNKTGITTLSDGDSVEVFCKGGNINNSWIGLKHG